MSLNREIRKESNERTLLNDCYIVSKGDTLYSIAWRYDYDYKKLANWNEITSPYIIHLGRKICFKPIKVKKALKSKSKSDATDSVIDEKTGSNRNLKKSTNLTDKKISKKKPKVGLEWFWPTKGKIVKLNSPTSKKGLG